MSWMADRRARKAHDEAIVKAMAKEAMAKSWGGSHAVWSSGTSITCGDCGTTFDGATAHVCTGERRGEAAADWSDVQETVADALEGQRLQGERDLGLRLADWLGRRLAELQAQRDVLAPARSRDVEAAHRALSDMLARVRAEAGL